MNDGIDKQKGSSSSPYDVLQISNETFEQYQRLIDSRV